jgi:hypothetical protein
VEIAKIKGSYAGISVSYNLRVIHDSAADEAFHRHHPILAVVDIDSRFFAQLEQEDQRDAESWGVHLLDMIVRGFQPAINISDQAAGLKKAFDDHLPKTTLRFDHFHLIKASKDLVRFLKNRKDTATMKAVALYERKDRADKRGTAHDLDEPMRAANAAMAVADSLHELVDSLCTWLQYDVLQLPGSCPADREDLFDFIVDELRSITDEPRIQTHVRSLIYQKDDLLAVAHSLDGKFQYIADQHAVSIQDIWEICYTPRL